MNRDEKIKRLLKSDSYNFADLRDILELLRSEGGCPWDMEQTHESIRKDFIEETYEVIEAIDIGDEELLREELGDVLLQVFFHARIEEEKDTFNINDVVSDVCAKLIHRHPHVFGNISVKNSDEVLENWDNIKNEEKSRDTITSRLRSVPISFPALMKASKVGKRANVLDFPDEMSALDKINEEADEIRAALESGNRENLEEEIGDLLFSAANLARKCSVDAEIALNNATEKFVNRFEKWENLIISKNLDIEKLSEKEKNLIWDEIKQK